jgi:hypothetical protein
MWPMSGYAVKLPGEVLAPAPPVAGLCPLPDGVLPLPCQVLLLVLVLVAMILAAPVGPLLLRCKVNVSTDSSLEAEVTAKR